MATTEIVAPGTTEAFSAEFTLVAGEETLLFLVDAAGDDAPYDARGIVELKTTAGFVNSDSVRSSKATTVQGPGTYRVRRLAYTTAFGVQRSAGVGGSAGDASAANQATEIARLESILAKLVAAPATEAKQDIGNTGLAAILAKLLAAPATEANQSTGIARLDSILAKLIAAPATADKQDDIIAAIAAGGGANIGKTYMVYGEWPAAVGEYSYATLAALSGGTDGDMCVESIDISCAADCYLVYGLDTDSGAGTTRNARETGSSTHPAFSIGRCYMGSAVAATAPIVGRVCIGANEATTFRFARPYALKDGESQYLGVRCSATNTPIAATFHFYMTP